MIVAAQAIPPAPRPGPAGRPQRGSPAAFTLLEILLAVAILGLLSAALVTGALHALDNGARSPEQAFWEASAAARETALLNDRDVILRYDEKDKAFVVDDQGGAKNFPVTADADLAIDFLQARSDNGSVLIGGQLVDTRTLPSVSYYADGTCSPFRVQFHGTGPARVIAIDPWTCAPVLTPPDSP